MASGCRKRIKLGTTYHVPVGANRWQVRTVESDNAALGGDSAACHAVRNEIVISEALARSELLEVKLHEYVHAALESWGVDVGQGDEEKEEMIVNIIGIALAQILRSRGIEGEDI